MLLRTLKLKDFRQFKGVQKISFSTDEIRKVTVIMGEIGTGKTTLAQSFGWCLYGITDFEDKNMICKSTLKNVLPGRDETVRVEVGLTHNNIDYTIIREQRYSKNNKGKLNKPNQAVFKIAYKKNGQQEFVKALETDMRMKEILPQELSKYFFFDGERIGSMSKEIGKGKSKEFAHAVKGLLGLSAIKEALNHLNGSKPSVMKSYDESYDSKSDSKIADYTNKINSFEKKIFEIDKRLSEIDIEEEIALDKCENLNDKIKANAKSSQLAKEKSDLKLKLGKYKQSKKSYITSLLKSFRSNATRFSSKKLINDSLKLLATADKLDKGIPDIHKRTIDFLIKRGECICGRKIEVGNESYINLNELLQYIPPQSVGTIINSFVKECEIKNESSENLFDNIKINYRMLRDMDNLINEIENNINIIENKLGTMDSVGKLQINLNEYENEVNKLKDERDKLNREEGGYISIKEKLVSDRQILNLRNKSNVEIDKYKAYAQGMYDQLNTVYAEKENETRTKLEKNINEIFKSIYNGGLSLSLDEKYNIKVIVNDFNGFDEEVETSTAQSMSIIFAFIAGIIKIARESSSSNDKILVSEPYPLVMDAPLSNFDKTRIKTVCEALPKVAEQVIIFIKDTDGDIAEEHMGNKVGAKYLFNKKNEIETYIIRR